MTKSLCPRSLSVHSISSGRKEENKVKRIFREIFFEKRETQEKKKKKGMDSTNHKERNIGKQSGALKKFQQQFVHQKERQHKREDPLCEDSLMIDPLQ